MDYYKNSMRYVKIILFFVVFVAIFSTVMRDKMTEMIMGKNNPSQEKTMQEIQEGQILQKQREHDEFKFKRLEEAYVQDEFDEYLRNNPNTPPDSYERIKSDIRNEFRKKYGHIDPSEINYNFAPNEVNNMNANGIDNNVNQFNNDVNQANNSLSEEILRQQEEMRQREEEMRQREEALREEEMRRQEELQRQEDEARRQLEEQRQLEIINQQEIQRRQEEFLRQYEMQQQEIQRQEEDQRRREEEFRRQQEEQQRQEEFQRQQQEGFQRGQGNRTTGRSRQPSRPSYNRR